MESFGQNFFRRSDSGGASGSWVTKTTSIVADQNSQNSYAPFVVDPGNGERVLYGTTQVWETTNGGDSWTAISSTVDPNGFNSGGSNVDTIALAPSDSLTIYASTGGEFATSSRIFVTTDHGLNWIERDLPAGACRVNELQVDPGNAQIAYAVINQFCGAGNVFKIDTTNGGTTWTNISGNLPSEPVWSLQIDPNGILYVGADDGVYATSNGGTTWSRFGTGLPHAQVFQLELNYSLLILGAATHGRGAWEIQITVPPAGPPGGNGVGSLAIDPSNPATLYAGTNGGGVFKSINGGTSWTASNSGLTNTGVVALVIDPLTPATLYAGTSGGGVFKSANGGTSWTAVNSGLTGNGLYVHALAIDPSTPATLYAGTPGGGVFKSTNGGTSWTAVNSGLTLPGAYALAIDRSTPATLYAGSFVGVSKSTNGGASWTASLAVSYVFALVIDPSTPATLYAGTDFNGVFKSTNGGTSWTAVSFGLTNTGVRALAIEPSSPATLYAGTIFNGGVFKSTDGAATWHPTGANSGNGALPATADAKVSGDNQIVAAGQPLRYPLVAVVTNADGIPVAGVTVNFAVTAGGGTLSATQVTTDSQGVALITVTLGPTVGTSTVTATADGLTDSPLTFTATAIALKKRRGQITSD